MLKRLKSIIKKITGLLKLLLHLTIAGFIAVIYALYCDGRIGWFFLFVLIEAILFAEVYVWIFSKALRFSYSQESEIVEKGEMAKVILTVENKWYLPSLPLTVYAKDCYGMTTEHKKFTVFLKPKEVLHYSIPFKSKYSGLNTVGVDHYVLSSMTGFASLKLAPEDLDGDVSFGVVPDIADVGAENEYIRTTHQSVQGNEESEETLDRVSNVFGGFPGYEHREYQPGDPVKRINWKLAAGKEKLYVRLDEMKAGSGISILLYDKAILKNIENKDRLAEQYRNLEDEDFRCLLQQNLLETALGHVKFFVNNNLSVLLYWTDQNGEYQKTEIADESDLLELPKKMAYFHLSSFDVLDKRVGKLKEELKEAGTLLCCVAIRDKALDAFLGSLKSEETLIALYEAWTEEGTIV